MKQFTSRLIVILLVTSCTAAGPSVTPRTPAVPEPISQLPDRGPWTFSYRSDTLRYQVIRSASIESQGDSAVHREISTNNTHEIVSLAIAGDTVRYTAVVDSFSTANQGLVGPVQPVTLPIEVSGTVDSLGLNIDSTATDEQCNPLRSNLESDVRNLLISLPPQLSPGTSWRDSSVTASCLGSVPARAIIIRHFVVAGATTYANESTVTIQRTDSISAQGQGRQQQHQLKIEISGTGSATYHVTIRRGHVMHLATSEDLSFVVKSASRTDRLRESVKEEFSLLP
jgi:hypothetical protein